MVRTDGPDGKLHDYEVKYVFGVMPLQQYLVELDNGRLQALVSFNRDAGNAFMTEQYMKKLDNLR